MEFALANLWQDFKHASNTEGTLGDNGNEVVLGPRLNEAVQHLANGYLKHLELGPEHKATDERAKLLDVHWGRIELDGAQIRGLGAAMTNFAEVLGANVTKLAESWKGESYDAFKAAIDKVQVTLATYGEQATITGEGLVNAMSQIREIYQTFADDSADKHLNFGQVSAPEKWHKMTDHEAYSGFELAEACPTDHGAFNCTKNNDEQRNIITDRFVSERRWGICKDDPCFKNAGRVMIMYNNMVDECQAAIDRIKGKLDNYFGAVQTTVRSVSELYGAAVGNVHNLADEQVFTSLRVIGGQPAGGGPPMGGDTSGYPTGGGGGPVDGGYPGGGMDTGMGPASVAEPMPPEPAPVDTAAAQEPPAAEVPGEQRETVEIKDGDRTIGVSSPDGDRVMVTVTDAAGVTKTYELDFATASGLATGQATDAVPGPDGVVPEQIAARTDGRCVIQDGPLTITAERSLFSPDSIELVVDDGSGGKPTTYTLDFEAQDTPPEDTTAAAPSGAPVADQPVQGSVDAGSPVSQQPPAAADVPGQGPAAGWPAGQDAQAPAAGLTSPQAWHGDGSVSGVLVPDQPDGEAHLGAAPDAAQPEMAGMAGAGLPIGGPAGGGTEAGGRAGSGWSVHGDLFDNAEPVYSMHGVLGDDEASK
ncbi:hypothetical protein [Actinophytocola sp.]|uniref:hypothetical protein n=1 Tax=Actinophytocola sp. TaxID=1872138 RepID=UPI002ECFCD34